MVRIASMAVVTAVAIVTAMAVIAAAVVAAMPVAMIPGIIAGPEIDPDIARIIPVVSGRIGSVRISIIRATIIAAPDSDPYPNMHSGIGLAGEAQGTQQRND
jgi:hypothetical protein